MKKVLLILSVLFLAIFTVLFSSASRTDAVQDTCLDENLDQGTNLGWHKVDSDDLSLYPVAGATEYCFKAGSDNSECDGGLFSSWPQPEGTCDLSHWSYFISTVTPTPTPTETPTPTPTPTDTEEEPTPTNTPTPTPTQTPNIGGPGDGLSDGRSDGRSDGLSSGVGGAAVLGVTTAAKKGEVLGASTMAATGSFPTTLASMEQVFGAALVVLGAGLHGKKKFFKKSK